MNFGPGIQPHIKVTDGEKGLELRRTFIKQKYEVVAFNRQLQPGNYVFPFKMPVDPVRPASNTVKDVGSNLDIIRVYYKLKVQVNSRLFESMKMSAKNTILLEFLQAVPMPIVPLQIQGEETINTRCCYAPQSLKWNIVTDKNAYTPGETINLNIMIDASNFTSKDVAVNVKMIRYTIINNKPILADSMQPIQTVDMPPVHAGKKYHNSVLISIPMFVGANNYHGIFAKWYTYLSIGLDVSCGGSHEIRVPLTIYGLPTLGPNPPITFPPEQAVEVSQPVVLDQLRILHPY